MKISSPLILLISLLLGQVSQAAVSISPSTVRTRYTTSAPFTITGATSGTLDGTPLNITAGVTFNLTVTSIGYHELTATDGVTPQTVAFIVKNSERGSTEDGIPTMVPYHFVNDAPSAFAAGELKILAPSTFPLNLPLPVVGRLIKGSSFGATAGDPLFLNGLVSLAGSAATPVQLRRGWGSTILPPATVAGTLSLGASVNSLTNPKSVTLEAATTYTTKGGTVTTADNWGSNARIYLNTKLIIAAGGSVTVGAGTIVKCASGVEIEIAPGASMAVSGTTADPVVFVPENATQLWGGVWLQPKTGTPVAQFTATGTIFCRWGNNQTYLNTAPHNLAAHRPMEPCFTLSSGGVLNLTDCALVGPTGLTETRGSAFASAGGFLNLTRVLAQRCITGGEQVGGGVEINQSAIMEMTDPGVSVDSSTFVDADNDGIYLVPGSGVTYHVTKTVIGWTKDDGIDTGGDGSGTTVVTNCWFENCVHEAISNSGVGRVPESHHSVHFNSGQGMECGYGGPLSLVDNSLLIGNMVGARFGDNYGSNAGTNGTGTSQYDGTITVQNSLSLNNYFHDSWAIDFSRWTYSNNRLIMTGSKVSKAADLAVQNGAEDSGNSLFVPATDGALLAGYMPVPDSSVGVDLLLDKHQDALAAFPASVNVRLSTFSSKQVSVTWQAVGKTTAVATAENILASGTLTFAQGETLKTIAPSLPANHGYASVVLRLASPVNAEITGLPAYYFNSSPPAADQVLITKSASGWNYFAVAPATPSDHSITWPPNDAGGRGWTTADFIEPTTAPNAWKLSKTSPIGWGNLGAAAPYLTLNTTLVTTAPTERNITTYYRKTFTISNPATVTSLVLQCLADDGAAVYLNGVRVSPVTWGLDPGTSVGGALYFDQLSSRYKSDGAAESDYDSLTLSGAAVPTLNAAPAVNVLAIELHQQSTGSGDGAVDAQLTASFGVPTNSPSAFAESYTANGNSPLTIAAPGLLANDTDPDAGTTLTAYVDSAPLPAQGTVTVTPNGSFTFTPAPGFTGLASFTYRAFDGLLVSDPAQVSITVVQPPNQAPAGVADSRSYTLGTTLTVPAPGVLSNDTDPDAGTTLTAVLVAGPSASEGVLVLNPDGSFSFTPATNFSGATSFFYRASDGSLTSSLTTVTLTASLDGDNDGLPDLYEIANFGDLNQNGTSDFDHDGLDNATELLAGTAPNNGASSFTVGTIAATDGSFSLNFPSVPGKTYTIEYKNSLGDPSWQVLSSGVSATGSSTPYTDSTFGSVGTRFYRVRIE